MNFEKILSGCFTMNDATHLLHLAETARKKAYAPYSGFRVGAALLSASGRIYTGCNMENAAYGPTLCAERAAFARAIGEGEREFIAIAVVGGETDLPCYPCGVCRQVMAEFCTGDFRIYTADGRCVIKRTLDELLPDAFGPDTLTSHPDKDNC